MGIIHSRRRCAKPIIKKTAVFISALIILMTLCCPTKVTAAGTYDYNDAASLATALGNAGAIGVTLSGGQVTGSQFNTSAVAENSLIVLSHADPALYANATLTFNTEQLDLTGTYGGKSFAGLGGEDAPFCGTLQRALGEAVFLPKVNRALFNAIDIKATLPADIRFSMTSGNVIAAPLFAENVTSSTVTSKTWNFTLTAVGQSNADITTGGFIGTVGANIDDLTIGLSFESSIGTYRVNAGAGNAGGICNTLSQGSKLTVTAFSPNAMVNINGADAGAVVGSMDDNAKLVVNTFAPSKTVTVGGTAAAGGIVGHVGGGTAKVTVGAFSPQTITVTANTYAGGVAGFLDGSTLEITGNYAPMGAVNISATSQAGGAVGGVGEGGAISLSSFSPRALAVTSTGANAGGIVGTAGNDTALTVGTFSPSGTVTINGATGAGSLIGSFVGDAAHGTAVTLSSGWSVPSGATLTVTGNQFAGGLFGQMTDGTVNLGAGQTIAFDNKTTVKGKNVGGIYGKLILSASSSAPASDYNTSNRINLENTASGETLGGVVGLLTLADQNAVYTVGGTDAAHKMNVYTSIKLPSDLNNSVGGVIGSVYSTAAASKNAAVTVQNTVANMNFTSNDSLYNGGIIGKLGDGNGVYALIQDCEVKTDKPTGRSYGFGGAVSYMSDKSVLKVANFKLDTSSKELSGAGVVSRINQDAVLCFSGTLDLSDAKFGGNALGQVVGEQRNSLVYATSGFVFNRGYANAGVNVNDIGNYGEVIRLGGNLGNLSADLFTIDTDNKVALKSGAMYGYASNEVTVASADQFAVLACSMQNNFFLASGISRTNWNENSALLGKTIKITADINLTETGVYSLMRDMWESDGINFGGTLMGVGSPAPTITIDTGAAWGNKHANGNNLDGRFTGMDRNGEKHSNLGLLRSVKGTVVIKNLKIDGTYTYYAGRNWGKGGVLVAYGDGNVTFEDIEVDVATKFYVAGGDNDKPSDIGCLIASGINKSNGTLTVKNVTIKNEIDVVRTAGAAKFGCIMGRLTSGGFDNITLEDVTFLADVEIVTGGSVQGGMAIGLIEGSGTLTVRNVVFGNETTKAKFMSDANSGGGLLGYDWTVDVVFDGTESAYGLHVKNAEMTANNINFGALCYQAYGYWNVPAYSIKLEGLTVNKSRSGTTGLLINKAPATDKKALYLELSSPNSYYIGAGVSISVPSTSSERFDELVRQLYDDEKELVNGQSIISVATSDGGGVNAGEISNTYYNRTTNHGEVWYVNGNARYYYNLHLYRTKNEAGLSPAEKLLIWSVRQYTTSYIKDKCFTAYTGYPLNCAADTVFDLRGYSYFPVDAAGITVKKATVIFDNDSIDQKENLKGTSDRTKMLTYRYSPHYMMHSGLFNDINGDLTVDELTLQGNVTYSRRNTQYSSSCDDNNGVLIGGTVASGADDSHKNTLNIKRVVLDGIYLNGYDDSNVYAPLLINKIGEYVTLNMETVYTKNDSTPKNKYEDTNANGTWHAASSLIGDIGWYNSGDDTGAKGITLTFSDIRLDGRPSVSTSIGAYGTCRSIFSRATLINSFRYRENCSGTYNFTKEEDWDGSTHKQWVTYGYEISGSTKNPNEQLRYYDSKFYTNATESPNESTGSDFLAYLPYVFVIDTGAYEIDVNLTIYVFVDGCGTYGDPYIITRGGQIEGLEYFLANDKPKNSVIVCVYYGNTDTVHISADSDHKYYRFNSSTETWDISDTMTSPAWTADTVSTADILEYMRTAYYYIDEDITISGTFVGLGTRENPFAGVIVGKTATPTVSIEGYQANAGAAKVIAANGLINVAKGCVVKNLAIVYENDGTVTVTNDAAVGENTIADYFGGVIGYVIGGDNVIDGVSVSLPTISVTLGNNSNHLCTVGGMVGVIRSGGVLFRGTNTVTGVDGRFGGSAYATLYFNTYVGRVLDGYAFSEGGTVNNNDKQYKIPTVSAGQMTVSGSTVTVASPRDLYLVSALYNSGAIGSKDAAKPAGYDGDARYRGRASYANVKPASVGTAEADYTEAKKDNSSSDGSYLFSYFNGTLDGTNTYNVNFGADIDFGGASGFDGTAFRGLGSRYDATFPRLTVGNAQNRTLTLSMCSREYANDNFLSRGIGFINQLGISIPNAALTVDGSVEAKSYTAGGATAVLDITPVISGGDAGRKAGVGGFAGYVRSDSAMTVKGVTLGSGLTVSGSYCVGGLVGMKDGGGALTMQDCFANGVTVKSDIYAGGLIGLFVGTVNVKATASDSVHGNITVMPNNTTTVRDYATFGGFAGYAKVISIGEDGKTVSIGNICVANQSSRGNVFIGGLIGNADQTVDMKNVTMTGVIVNGAENRARSGGVIGKISDAATAVTLDNVNVALGNDGYIYGKYAGGYIGFYDKAGNGNVIIKNGNVSGALIRGNTAVGGIVGYVEKYASVFKALNMSVNVSDIKLSNGMTGGYVGGVIGQLEQGGPITIDDVRIAETASVNIIGSASAAREEANAVGGIVGRAAPSAMTISNVVIGENFPVAIVSGEDAGGIIGYVSSSGNTVTNATVAKNGNVIVNAVGNLARAGGIIGQSGNTIKVINARVGADTAKAIVEGGFSGGAIGSISAKEATIQDFRSGDPENSDARLIVGKLSDGVNTSYSGTSGGLIGLIDSSASTGTEIDGAILYNTEVYAENVAGGVIGIGARTFCVKNSAVIEPTVRGSLVGGNWTSSAAFAGRLTEGATADGYNILIKLSETSVVDSLGHEGLWVGSVDSASCSVKLIGVSVIDAPTELFDVNGSCTDSYIIYTDFDGEGMPTGSNGVTTANKPGNDTEVGSGNKYTLFGHGAAIKATDTPFPAYILGQTGRRGYTTDLTSNNMSTYKKLHTGSANDFAVFMIVDTDSEALTSTILQYADFITNGGARRYWDLDPSCVSVDTYEFSRGAFRKKTESTVNYSAGVFSLSGVGNRDSDKEQFTLITFTFTNGSVSKYKFYVPIIITKPIEVKIEVGIAQGAVFKDSLVDKKMEIIEYGKRATARVNYKYYYDNWNTDDLAWSYAKDIKFTELLENIPESMKLPAGTYITLIDTQSNDLAYSYVVEGDSINKLLGNSFVDWEPKTMASLLKAELATDVNDPYALWVIDDGNAEITVGGVGYRKKTAEDTGNIDVYVLLCEETYFIVFELPNNDSVDVQYRSILFLFDKQLGGGFANAVEVLQESRNLKIYKDTVQEFTKVSETLNGIQSPVVENSENEIVLRLRSVLALDQNVVTETTERYMKFNVGLKCFNTVLHGYRGAIKLTPTFEIISEGSAPITIYGSVINMNYNGQKQITVPVNDHGTMIDLAEYTDMGQKQVTINTTLTFEFAQQAVQSMFPTAILSGGVPSAYVSFDPTMVITDNGSFLGGNRQKVSNEGALTKYYRGAELNNLLELTADASQLGINPGAASEPEDANAIIDAIGSINLVGYESELAEINSITVAIRLYKKDNSGTYQPIGNAAVPQYLNSVKIDGDESLDYTWTFLRGDGSYQGLFEEGIFEIPLKLEVKRKPSVTNDIIYANYKVEMEVSFNSGGGNNATSKDYFIYTLAKIAEDF